MGGILTTALTPRRPAPAWSASPTGPSGPGTIVSLMLGDERLVAVAWGRHDGFGTPAYWVAQTQEAAQAPAERFGAALLDEVCFCLLGGYGVTAEVNDAAYEALKDAGLLCPDPVPSAAEIESVLARPLHVRGRRRPVRYRFPSQRATRLSAALGRLGAGPLPSEPVELRDALLAFAGVGPKTASWIVRNHTGSSDVAIIDVHLRRAGLAAGFFRPQWRLPQDYHLFEAAFLAYAGAGGVAASDLDICIWEQVRRLGRAAPKMLPPLSSPD